MLASSPSTFSPYCLPQHDLIASMASGQSSFVNSVHRKAAVSDEPTLSDDNSEAMNAAATESDAPGDLASEAATVPSIPETTDETEHVVVLNSAEHVNSVASNCRARDLKERLKAMDLPTNGSKTEMVQRLIDAGVAV